MRTNYCYDLRISSGTHIVGETFQHFPLKGIFFQTFSLFWNVIILSVEVRMFSFVPFKLAEPLKMHRGAQGLRGAPVGKHWYSFSLPRSIWRPPDRGLPLQPRPLSGDGRAVNGAGPTWPPSQRLGTTSYANPTPHRPRLDRPRYPSPGHLFANYHQRRPPDHTQVGSGGRGVFVCLVGCVSFTPLQHLRSYQDEH